MNSLIEDLNKTFESRVRLGIMSALVVNESLDFTSLKTSLNLTDGNLSSHIASLENEGYVKAKKEFVGKKPQTTYAATAAGRRAFTDHLNALEKLIRTTQ